MLKTQFNAIVEWQDKTFPDANALSKINHLTKEVCELYSAVNFKTPGVAHEFADCIFLIYGAAAKAGMQYDDIIKAIEEKFMINQHRQWGKPDENGVVEHVRENELCECDLEHTTCDCIYVNECSNCGKPLK